MATHLTITATHDGSVGNRELREALRGIDADDISQSSPVTSPSRLATVRDDREPEDEEPAYRWLIRSGDRDEVFTKKTTDAIVAAVSTLDGVSEVAVDGGYEEIT
ncbi:MAG: hypothetical protein R3324_18450 [Halobacteriales archaeon]|nr:hypothetical protein [Halobacteriales archaeon]